MHFSRNNHLVVAFFLLMTLIASSIVAIPLVTAHSPPSSIPTWTYVTVNPNPVGVGQTATVVFWLNWMPRTAAGAAGDRWFFYVDVTDPDGNKQTLGPFKSDPVGGSFTAFTPDKTGNYTFTARFPGQVLTGSNGTGIYNYNIYINDTFQASSATTTLDVQEQKTPDPLTYPLPSEYWTRPIEGQNTDWYTIASNWLGGSHIVGQFQPDGSAPNSPHVMWTKPIQFGGVVGGNKTYSAGATYYDGTAYEGKFTGPIIMYGQLYYNLPRSDVGSGGGYSCVDLRTGEEIFWENMTAPNFGQLYYYESMNQHGVVPNGYLWRTASAGGVTTWMAYNPLNGNWLFNLTNVPSGTSFYGPNGEILIYQLNYNGRWLALWNNTCEQQGLHGGTGTSSSAYQWRPVGKSVNMSKAYSWNVTIKDLPGSGAPTIVKIIPDDMIIGRSTTFSGISDWGTPEPWTMWAISLKPESRGSLLWIKDYSVPAGNLTLNQGLVDEKNRVFTIWYRDSLQWAGYSIDDGRLLWTTLPEDPWGFYAHTCVIAYGKLYSSGYGIVYCYDTATGKQVWNYSQSGALDVPYTHYPLSVTAVADGKVYMGIIEHSAGAPYWKGAQLHCVNATTGEKIWSLASHTASTAGGLGAITTGYAVADGYYVYLNLYDMQIYCLGKGASATTVDASPAVSVQGSSVLIKGFVTDISAGTKQQEQAMRFPNGVPAVSDQSMSDWMEYVYMQKPKLANTTGVPVTIDVIDANGNFRNIGQVTSDENGFYCLDWEPDIAGTYTVISTFAGSESYWQSHAETAFTVSEPTATQTPTTTAGSSIADLYFVPAIAGLIAAIAIVGIVMVVLLLKKKP